MSGYVVRALFEGSVEWRLGPYGSLGKALRAAGQVSAQGLAIPGESGGLVVLPGARLLRALVEESAGDEERAAALVDEAALVADAESEAARPSWWSRLFGRAA